MISEFWPFRDTETGVVATTEEPEAAVESVSLIPRAWFGTATTPLPDPADGKEEDPDDEELPETPPDVIAMLGFDPLDWDDEDGAADPETADEP